MTRLETTFSALKSQSKKALIPYVMAGDPSPDVTVDLLHALVADGADAIELGLPFSDPMADGPTIALAAERALAAGTSTSDVFGMVRAFRQKDTSTPIVLMGYLNPIEIMGYEVFAEKCADAGVDGVLMVDLPPEEAGEFSAKLRDKGVNLIFLIAPTTTEARIQSVLAAGSGYIYYVSLKGVTGAGNLDTAEVDAKIQALTAKTELPICVGFGISDGASAKACGAHAAGVIVGSALVKQFAEGDLQAGKQAISAKMRELRGALDE